MSNDIDIIEAHINAKTKNNQNFEKVKEKILGYINDHLTGFTVNNIDFLDKLLKKHGVKEILKAIDTSAEKYLRFDSNGHTKESAETFLEKIAGIVVNNHRPMVENKCSYIKGICRNNFGYWDNRVGSIIINNYVQALREYGWSESRILHDLETEVQPKTIKCKNWSEWKSFFEKWTDDVKQWEGK